ncbi:uncharacterized protein B0H18DRAFT_960150 [Fomitopsis serialis]|uniref:uncharacterized protein n=1 Tax=Fomitopsis serialis TaxID=139415 RepID=UPI00200852B0|nr:uncharacterized protein B0H18DRAFT_960150 [Neoantrodia serialis]KAH9913756.1 hypothetical protein B0H18DRAFT_960150 [Neoantrodia serialis]
MRPGNVAHSEHPDTAGFFQDETDLELSREEQAQQRGDEDTVDDTYTESRGRVRRQPPHSTGSAAEIPVPTFCMKFTAHVAATAARGTGTSQTTASHGIPSYRLPTIPIPSTPAGPRPIRSTVTPVSGQVHEASQMDTRALAAAVHYTNALYESRAPSLPGSTATMPAHAPNRDGVPTSGQIIAEGSSVIGNKRPLDGDTDEAESSAADRRRQRKALHNAKRLRHSDLKDDLLTRQLFRDASLALKVHFLTVEPFPSVEDREEVVTAKFNALKNEETKVRSAVIRAVMQKLPDKYGLKAVPKSPADAEHNKTTVHYLLHGNVPQVATVSGPSASTTTSILGPSGTASGRAATNVQLPVEQTPRFEVQGGCFHFSNPTSKQGAFRNPIISDVIFEVHHGLKRFATGYRKDVSFTKSTYDIYDAFLNALEQLRHERAWTSYRRELYHLGLRHAQVYVEPNAETAPIIAPMSQEQISREMRSLAEELGGVGDGDPPIDETVDHTTNASESIIPSHSTDRIQDHGPQAPVVTS